MHDGTLTVPDDNGPLTRAMSENARIAAGCPRFKRFAPKRSSAIGRFGTNRSILPTSLYPIRRVERTKRMEKSVILAAGRQPIGVKYAVAGVNMIWRTCFEGPQFFAG